MSAIPQDQRPRFFEGQFLSARDLSAAVDHARTRAARHDLGAHTWGIATGLTLRETELPGGQVEVHILPGYAWDGFGRPVVVLAPFKVPAEKFSAIRYNAAIDAGGAGRLLPIWLRYDEEAGLEAPGGFEACGGEDRRSRVRETFRVEIGYRPDHRQQHDPVSLAGQSVDAEMALQRFAPAGLAAPVLYDESVPHQSFPDRDPPALWLIPVGLVRWLPEQNGPGSFLAATADDIAAARRLRRYAGVVAETVYAADGAVRIRDRADDPAASTFDPAAGDLAWVEGDLRVVGDARVAGGALDFRDVDGNDYGTSLLVRRAGDGAGGAAGNRTLEFVIGPDSQTTNRAVFGMLKGDGTLEPQVVLSNGDLIFSATSGAANDPGDIVFVNAAGAVKGRIWSRPQAGAGLFLSSGATTAQLAIDAAGNVGVGTEAPTLKLDVRGDFGRADGSATLHLFGSRIGDTGGGVLSLRSGGNVVAFNGGDNVGIGTAIPNRPLTVQDDAGGAYINVKGHAGAVEVLLGADGNGGIVSSMTNHDLVLRAGGNSTKVWIKAGGNVGIGTNTPQTPLEVNGAVRLGPGGNLLATGGVEALRAIRGSVSSVGAVTAGSGFTVARLALGIYRIRFDLPFPNPPSAVATQIFPGFPGSGGGDTRDNAVILYIAPDLVGIKTGDSDGDASDRDFSFVVMGPA